MKLVDTIIYLQSAGGLAQLARALAWHARGRRFDPDTLHKKSHILWDFLLYCFYK